jgi:uncharacterized protein YqhQ
MSAMLGGQAVMDGVMVRGAASWALALRTRAGEIDVRTFPLPGWRQRRRAWSWPLLRGIAALVESLQIGSRALRLSVEAREPDGAQIPARTWALTLVLGLLFAVGLFFVVPVTLTSLLRDQLASAWAFWLVEGVVRTGVFIAYLVAVSRVPDLRRLFEYHGAEHKAIACLEAGEPLDPLHAHAMPRLHPRCGTTFLLLVMLVAIAVFAPLGLPDWWLLVASRVLGIPLIVGLTFELVRLRIPLVMWPGMQLQRLTTREPSAGQLAVAIAALEAVVVPVPERGLGSARGAAPPAQRSQARA